MAEERYSSRYPAANLRSYQNWFWPLLSARTSQPSFHRFNVQSVEHEDIDIICVRGYFCRRRTSKWNATQGRICLLDSKPTEQGLQREDIEKRKQEATLTDRPLDRERLRVLPVHLYHRLQVVVHYAYPFAELLLESGCLQTFAKNR